MCPRHPEFHPCTPTDLRAEAVVAAAAAVVGEVVRGVDSEVCRIVGCIFERGLENPEKLARGNEAAAAAAAVADGCGAT